MDKLLKCPNCNIIQSKGKYCIYDGQLLVKNVTNDADLEVRNVLNDIIIELERNEEVKPKNTVFHHILKNKSVER